MAYISKEIKDRIAIGDDCFYMEQLSDGRIRLIPAPDTVVEPGTDINKALLQSMEDRITWLMNSIFNNISANPFSIEFNTLDGLTIEGVWNESLRRIECHIRNDFVHVDDGYFAESVTFWTSTIW